MDTTTAVPRVLVIGLDPYRVPGPWDPAPVAAAIRAGMARFADHGVGAESCLFGLDGSDDVEGTVAAALGARPWECVVIGGGLRSQRHGVRHVRRGRPLDRRPRLTPGPAAALSSAGRRPPS